MAPVNSDNEIAQEPFCRCPRRTKSRRVYR